MTAVIRAGLFCCLLSYTSAMLDGPSRRKPPSILLEEDQQINYATIMRRDMLHRCESTQTVVSLDLNSNRLGPLTEMGRQMVTDGLALTAGDQLEEGGGCRGEFSADKTMLVLTVAHDQCDTVATAVQEGTLYETTILVTHSVMKFNFTETFTCLKYRPDIAIELTTEQRHLMEINENYNAETLNYGDQLGINIVPRNENGSDPSAMATRNDIFSYPTACWLSRNAEESPANDRRYIFKDGCPQGGFSKLMYSVDSELPVTVEFKLDTSLLPKREQDIASEGPFSLYIHCEAFTCYTDTSPGIANIPKCPSPSECHSTDRRTKAIRRRLATRLRQIPQKHTVSRIEIEQTQEMMLEKRCKLRCEIFHSHTRNRPQPEPWTNTLNTERPPTRQISSAGGMATWSAIVVSLASFLLGMVLMAAIWFLHVHTDPKRKLAKSSYSSLPTTVNGTEMRNLTTDRNDVAGQALTNGHVTLLSTPLQLTTTDADFLYAHTNGRVNDNCRNGNCVR